ncbi:hypothetical protein BDF20DRAFT_306886 [Mycotypha africana]|uniref:uncharacterized protein n=1 Tax=Mycotypha africana TaxID=64632 RepID=UPI0023005C4E|nr:uncharacterized protein BDF20DRAFT_306886 [Mycotypha africana]KAI8988133.1 hypothetical protein BDF20DRAFT_306886 [Mycotypha africana]
MFMLAKENNGKLRLNREASKIQESMEDFLSQFYNCYLYTMFDKKTKLYWTRIQLSQLDDIQVSAKARTQTVGYMVYYPQSEYVMYTGPFYTSDQTSLKEAVLETFHGDRLQIQTLKSDAVQYLQHVVYDKRSKEQFAHLLIQQQQQQLQAQYDDEEEEMDNGSEGAKDGLKISYNSLSSNPLDIRQRQDPALSLLHNEWDIESGIDREKRLSSERRKRIKHLTDEKEGKERIRQVLQNFGFGQFYGSTELDIDVELPFDYDDDEAAPQRPPQTPDSDTMSMDIDEADNEKDHSHDPDTSNTTSTSNANGRLKHKPLIHFHVGLKGENIPHGIRNMIRKGHLGPEMPSWLIDIGITSATKFYVNEEGVKELNGLEEEEVEDDDNKEEERDHHEEQEHTASEDYLANSDRINNDEQEQRTEEEMQQDTV